MKLVEFLNRSQASGEFRDSVEAFLRGQRPNERIVFDSWSPPVKVERTLTKLLEVYAELPIERVEIDGNSGCEYFRGEMRVFSADGERRVRFVWDCKWKAVEQGWTDYFGFPDQIRAAREFGYDCFRIWSEEAAPEAIGA